MRRLTRKCEVGCELTLNFELSSEPSLIAIEIRTRSARERLLRSELSRAKSQPDVSSARDYGTAFKIAGHRFAKLGINNK